MYQVYRTRKIGDVNHSIKQNFAAYFTAANYIGICTLFFMVSLDSMANFLGLDLIVSNKRNLALVAAE